MFIAFTCLTSWELTSLTPKDANKYGLSRFQTVMQHNMLHISYKALPASFKGVVYAPGGRGRPELDAGPDATKPKIKAASAARRAVSSFMEVPYPCM